MPNKSSQSDIELHQSLRKIEELESECQALRRRCAELESVKSAAPVKVAKDDIRQVSEDGQRSILESSPFGVSVISRQDPNKRLFVNQRMLEMFGYESAEEMLSHSAADSYVNPEDLEKLRRTSAESGDMVAFKAEGEMERYRKDGSRWWCRLHRRLAIFEGQEVIIVWHADITKRKIAEQKLIDSQAKYASVVEGQSELISRFKPDGRFLFTNEAYLRFTGKSEQEVLSGYIYDDVPDEEIERLKSYFASFTPQKPVRGIDNKLKRHDGELRDVEWLDTAFFDEQGEIIEFQSVARDVTERRRARLALEKAKAQAQQASEAKSDFLATMSHEIRTPLNGVLGLAQLLRDSELNQEQLAKVDAIITSGHSLLTIVNDVLDVSKFEGDGMKLANVPYRLQELLSTIATPFQILAEEKGIKLRVLNNITSDLIVKGDPVRLRQVLWNLLSNAVKFTDQGAVTFTLREEEGPPTGEPLVRGRTLVFSVADTGVGIAPERIGKIFETFTQEDTSISRRFGGTGLGLSIVKHLVELMGGTISVESVQNKSTTFTVNLPVVEASAGEQETIMGGQPEGRNPSDGTLNVILAEDNPVNAMIAKAFLEKFGHAVRHAKNGMEAVSIVAENWADLVLMDVHMPEMDGVEATHIIRETFSPDHLPIVGLTAEAFFERHQDFRKAGMNDVLSKPYTENQLKDLIERNLSGRRSPSGPVSGHLSPSDFSAPVFAETRTEASKDTASQPEPAPESAFGRDFPIGDDEGLSEFLSHMDKEITVTLLEQAQLSLQTRMQELRQGIEASDCKTVKAAVHSIKGSCGSMFATRIFELAKKANDNHQDLSYIKKIMPALEQTSEETLKWWKGLAEKAN